MSTRRSLSVLVGVSCLLRASAFGQCETWSAAFGPAPGSGTDSGIEALISFDDSTGVALYAGGFFTAAGTTSAGKIARWDGSSWSPLAAGFTGNSSVRALAVFDEGTGQRLFAGGGVLPSPGLPVTRVARWDGMTWSALAGGITDYVFALEGDSSVLGHYLYRGGFTTAGGFQAPTVERWDGVSWSSIGGAFSGVSITSLRVFDDGTGPALYAGGNFTMAGSVNTKNIARWDGSNWSDVGGGLAGGAVLALEVFDDGTGPALYAGGSFAFAGGQFSPTIAKWKSGTWLPIGPSGSGVNGEIWALTVFNDGSGPALIAGGRFTNAGGSVANQVARFDGLSWSPLGSGVVSTPETSVVALASVDKGSGNGPRLFAGGTFTTAGGVPSSNIGEWHGCFSRIQPYCFGDGTGTPCPCGNMGAPGNGCANSAFPAGAELSGSGTVSVTSDSLLLTASNLTGSAAEFFQGSTSTPATVIDDGIGCVGGALYRLGTKSVIAHSAVYPGLGDPHVSVKGFVPLAGGTRFYQCVYRNPVADFCPPSMSNRTNGVSITWTP